MLCEKCKQRTASVHLSKIVNNYKIELYLCDVCAAEEGVLMTGFYHDGFNNFLSNFFNDSSSDNQLGYQQVKRQQIKCPECGLTEEKLLHNGRLGCAACYPHFAAQLDPLVRKIHGSSKHIGKVPSGFAHRQEQGSQQEPLHQTQPSQQQTQPSQQQMQQTQAQPALTEKQKEILQLKQQLQLAVKNEDFEQAAVLRDRIKAMEQNNQGEGKQ